MRLLVIGLGSMGRRRIRNLQALSVTEIYGFDLSAERREAAAKEYGINIVSDWSKAADVKADGWIVSTPPLTHMQYAVDALESGAHVFTEADLPDPLTAQAKKRRDETGLVLAPSCTMRHYPGPVKAIELVEEGQIGKPLVFSYHAGQYLPDWHPWENYLDFYVSKPDTGAAREIVPFELVWLTKLFGPVKDIAGLKNRSGALEADIDDSYAIAISFENGVAGTIMIDVLAQPEVRALRINGTEGALDWDQSVEAVRIRKSGDKDWTSYLLDKGTVESGYINPEEPYIAEIRDFLAAMEGKSPYPFCLEDELILHDALEKIERNIGTSAS
jgi:predicted dehydrogenase